MGFILDASKYQGSINWPQVRSGGCLGAIIKVGQGRTADPDWRINHDGARGAGIPVAPYYFSNDGNAASDASWFAGFWSAGWDWRWWLDEELSSANASYVNIFRSMMRAATGYQLAGVYSSESLLAGQLNPANWIDPLTGIWAARYGPSLGWSHPQLKIWQYSSSATVPGILGHVDESELMNGYTPAADSVAVPILATTEDEMGYTAQVSGNGDGTEQSVQVPAAGMKFLNFSTGFGNQLTIKQALCFGDTPNAAEPAVAALAPVHAAGSDWVIDNDRPGPVGLPAGVRTVSVLFTCSGNATIWTSLA
jgi:hypothetical protein